ncbi:hypothetical protein [Pseudomonas aeruginosa]|nr:hypothetical protein [Pseudomonas aeruginosa]MCO2926704.1 hypothetical protein [Pseudomonas aeruginosa]MCV6455354.1 hypothetical protein [Pseudomonas aeruginosa]MDP5511760.1 hypothetical protein [Pseudomonas aeruginosa]HBO2595367.1 hypothetical protein [Pseudomonas aeruginosa]HCF6697479.1 hypothetical protein [Pseudomonas aeruginosa]
MQEPAIEEVWSLVKKEIAGIQVIWEAANDLFFQPQGEGWRSFGLDTPLLFGLTQTVYIESLLMRVARLMDPSSSGRSGKQQNLSLAHMSLLAPELATDEATVSGIWDGSGLIQIRNKYLSHNDLTRQLAVDHTVNIPLAAGEIGALRALVEALLAFQQAANLKLQGASYLHEGLTVRVQAEVQVLSKRLLGGEQFFKLLPEHECLQLALAEVERD